jgi:transcriptional regulator with XRE-family HTH domain
MKGDQLKAFRTRHKMTQAELGKHLGTTGNTIARWERDEMSIPPHLDLALKGLEVELSKSNKT